MVNLTEDDKKRIARREMTAIAAVIDCICTGTSRYKAIRLPADKEINKRIKGIGLQKFFP